jgi:hypothetical protein
MSSVEFGFNEGDEIGLTIEVMRTGIRAALDKELDINDRIGFKIFV